jgi:transcriptional regulator GlxA family with amidase domain
MALSVSAAAQSKPKPLKAPANGTINVAFVVSDSANMMDFAGPWEVFQDVMIGVEHGDHQMPFRLYTVSDTKEPVRMTGGARLVPDYTFADAPQPQVVVVGAQRSRSKELMVWLKKQEQAADVVMSVCTGAFVLGQAGLLDGKEATTHHQFLDSFAERFPKVKLVRNVRYVENEKVSTAGGLTSGIDLALHVVERYFGREQAKKTAAYMEHESKRWLPEQTSVATR